MYQSVSPNVNFVEQEKKIEAFWEEEHIFEKSIDSRKKGTPYVFYDGPPTVLGCVALPIIRFSLAPPFRSTNKNRPIP